MARWSLCAAPKADTLKIEGDWTAAMEKAVSLERPPEGWPDNTPDNPAKKKRPKGKPEKG